MKTYRSFAFIALLFAFAFVAPPLPAATPRNEQGADSVMLRVFGYAAAMGGHIGHFDNTVYTKFHIDSHIRNFTIKFLPNAIDMPRGESHAFGENVTRYNYVDFGVVSRKEIAFYCSQPKLRKIPDILHSNVNAMIYEPTIYVGGLLSPFNSHNRSHYTYIVDSVRHAGGTEQAHVVFEPRHPGTQLVSGAAWVETETGRIDSLTFRAVVDNILHIQADIKTGQDGALSLLPANTLVNLHYKFGGNTVKVHLNSQMNYSRIDNTHYADSLRYFTKKEQYDITKLNLIPYDTSRVVRTKEWFDTVRPAPLLPEEDSALAAMPAAVRRKARSDDRERGGAFSREALEDILLSRHKLTFNENAMLSLPPVFTPSMVQWSGSRGVSLQARLKLDVDFAGGRSVTLRPRVGYSFRQKQMYWNVPLNLLLIPEIGAGIEASVRNGNRIYSSLQAREVRKQLEQHSNYDSMLNVFNKYNFNYYDDFFSSAAFYVEPLVGFKIHSGLAFHQRNLINWNSLGATNGMKRYYKSIAPYMNMEFTPALYYRRAGSRRIPLYSYWPTFRLSYERGVKWWTCNNRYERWEFDATYRINLRALSSVYLRGGGGLFTDRKEMYFVDYDNFSFQNMPTGWEDDMLGEFQLLNRHWYNESNYYTLLCTAYESPSLILARTPLTSKFIKRERLYLNAVSLHALAAYMEGGYGISTNFFDAAIFLGGGNASGIKVGAKLFLRFFDNW